MSSTVIVNTGNFSLGAVTATLFLHNDATYTQYGAGTVGAIPSGAPTDTVEFAFIGVAVGNYCIRVYSGAFIIWTGYAKLPADGGRTTASICPSDAFYTASTNTTVNAIVTTLTSITTTLTAITTTLAGLPAATWNVILTGTTNAGALLLSVANWIVGNTKQTADVATLIAQIGSGTGNNQITVNCKDQDGNNLQLVYVSAKLNSTTKGSGLTDVSGNKNLFLAAATYTISGTLDGYNAGSQTVVVSTDASVNLVLTRMTITPSDDPELATGWIIARDLAQNVLAGEEFELNLLQAPGDGRADVAEYATAISDINGLAQFPNTLTTAKYQARWLPNGEWVEFFAGENPDYGLPNLRP